jgi:hypothetical protein
MTHEKLKNASKMPIIRKRLETLGRKMLGDLSAA